MKRLDFINNRLRERNEARAYIKNVDEALLNYYHLFQKKKKKKKKSIRDTKMANYYLLEWV